MMWHRSGIYYYYLCVSHTLMVFLMISHSNVASDILNGNGSHLSIQSSGTGRCADQWINVWIFLVSAVCNQYTIVDLSSLFFHLSSVCQRFFIEMYRFYCLIVSHVPRHLCFIHCPRTRHISMRSHIYAVAVYRFYLSVCPVVVRFVG